MTAEFPVPDDRLAGKVKLIQFAAQRDVTSQNGSGGSAALVSRCAAEIAPEKIEWLWSGRIARGKHTCIAGEPGTGKSQLSIAIIAAVTTAGEWPCGEGNAPPRHYHYPERRGRRIGHNYSALDRGRRRPRARACGVCRP